MFEEQLGFEGEGIFNMFEEWHQREGSEGGRDGEVTGTVWVEGLLGR